MDTDSPKQSLRAPSLAVSFLFNIVIKVVGIVPLSIKLPSTINPEDLTVIPPGSFAENNASPWIWIPSVTFSSTSVCSPFTLRSYNNSRLPLIVKLQSSIVKSSV